MIALLTPRFWIGLAIVGLLTFTHAFVYRAGRAAVRADWDKERAAQVAQALQDSEARRMKEKALNFTNEGISNAYIKEKSRLVAARVAADDRLREFQAASDRATRERANAVPGTDDPYPAIADQCTRQLIILDDYAAKVASKARALQDYALKMRIIP